jgi:hypothetical protein
MKHKDLKLTYLYAARFTPVEKRMLSELERIKHKSKNTVIRDAVRVAHAKEARKAQAHQGN